MVVLDAVIILLAAAITFIVVTNGIVAEPNHYAAAVAFVWLTALMLLNFGGLYRFEAISQPLAYLDKIFIAFATTFLFLLAAAFTLKISTEYSRIWLFSFAVASTLGVIFARLLAGVTLQQLANRHVFSRNIVVVGAGNQIRKLLEHLHKTQPRFVSILGIFTDETSERSSDFQYPVLGPSEQLTSYVRGNEVDDIIIALPWAADEKISALMSKLRELPVNVYLASDLIGFQLGLRAPPDHFDQMPVVEVMGRPLAGWGGIQKALLDYTLGTILLIVAIPLMVLIAIAIKLDSVGPILFRQERYGFVNQVFSCYKFRTMKYGVGAKEKLVQATRDDPRITLVGRLLRRFSLDELPQLFNVLGGTMSLVGPRPHAVEHNEAYAKLIRGYFARHRVKPGLTGWAQVNGLRGETKTLEAMEARVNYDIYYVENWSMFFDLRILMMTIVVCLTGRNAY